jgi:hypothetical protein
MPVIRGVRIRIISAGLLVAVAATAQAAPRLRCQLDQGGVSKQIEVAPVVDPYRVASLDVNGRFLFKAVVVGDERHVAYVKLYAYRQTERQPVLLQEARYLAPAVREESLTGRQMLYSPRLEREFQYECRLIEVAP